MKKQLTLFLTFFIIGSTSLFSQIQDNDNQGFMTITLKKKDLSKITGTPYFDESYKSGSIFLEEKEPLKVFMRYDVQNETIEIKTDLSSDEIFILPSGKNAKYEIGNLTFLYDKINVNGKQTIGYFIEHFDGDHFRLLEKPLVTVTEAVAAKTGYEKDIPAEIKIESEFYIKKEGDKIENVRIKHKDIKNIFTSKAASEYLSKNRINSTDDLKDFLKYLDQK